MQLPVIVIGSGGHAKVLVDTLLALGTDVIGLTDSDTTRHGLTVLGRPILGDDELIMGYRPNELHLVNGLGAVTLPKARTQLYLDFKERGYTFKTVIHPTAYVARDVKLGDGVQIMAGAVIQAGVSLGANTIINTRAAIDHDCQIGAHVHVAPGVTMSGGVHIGSGSLVGVGTTLLQGVSVGEHTIIGAGSVILGQVPPASKVKGLYKGGY